VCVCQQLVIEKSLIIIVVQSLKKFDRLIIALSIVGESGTLSDVG
jgi:hypothetical protein